MFLKMAPISKLTYKCFLRRILMFSKNIYVRKCAIALLWLTANTEIHNSNFQEDDLRVTRIIFCLLCVSVKQPIKRQLLILHIVLTQTHCCLRRVPLSSTMHHSGLVQKPQCVKGRTMALCCATVNTRLTRLPFTASELCQLCAESYAAEKIDLPDSR